MLSLCSDYAGARCCCFGITNTKPRFAPPVPHSDSKTSVKRISLVLKISLQPLWRSAARSFFWSLPGHYLLWCLTETFIWQTFSSGTLDSFPKHGLQLSLSSTDISNCLSQQFLAPMLGPTISNTLKPFNTFRIESINACWYQHIIHILIFPNQKIVSSWTFLLRHQAWGIYALTPEIINHSCDFSLEEKIHGGKKLSSKELSSNGIKFLHLPQNEKGQWVEEENWYSEKKAAEENWKYEKEKSLCLDTLGKGKI